MSNAPRIVVVGSINMDLVVRCARLPVPGQTVTALSSMEIPGGKGANQAVAASRAGGQVTMIGRVGADSMASRLVDNLRQHHVRTERILTSSQCASGIAVVAVESSGENAIMVVPGANGEVSIADVDAATQILSSADILLLQLEIPLPTVLRVIDIAREAGVPVVLDPAPMPTQLPPASLLVDVLCPNQSEASAIVGYTVETVDDAMRAAQDLMKLGVRHPIVTLADQGAVIHDGASSHWIEPFRITAVDTTAAGDAFAGALTVRLAEGASLLEAARFAGAAGAIAATRLGAQPAMPNRAEIESLLRQSSN